MAANVQFNDKILRDKPPLFLQGHPAVSMALVSSLFPYRRDHASITCY
jgi:hypothetical protein